MKRGVRVGRPAFALLACVGVGAVLYAGRAPGAQRRAWPVAITNETESMRVVSSGVEDDNLVLVIKNTGDQPVVAYHLDWKAKEGLSRDLTDTGALAPGSQFTASIPLSHLEQDAHTGLYKLNIAMAFFGDGNAEGSWARAEAHRGRVAGAALAADQIGERVSRLSPHSAPQILKLADELKALTPPSRLSKWQMIGYEEAVGRALGQAEYLLQGETSPEKIERVMAGLRKSLDRQTALGRKVSGGGKVDEKN